MAETGIYATGRRKSAVARVWIYPDGGEQKVQNKSFEDYFGREDLLLHLTEPLRILELDDKIGIKAFVKGGGIAGQAGALRLGIARALIAHNPEYRPVLKKAGLLTRDPRRVERKKYGKLKARKKPQFSKR